MVMRLYDCRMRHMVKTSVERRGVVAKTRMNLIDLVRHADVIELGGLFSASSVELGLAIYKLQDGSPHNMTARET